MEPIHTLTRLIDHQVPRAGRGERYLLATPNGFRAVVGKTHRRNQFRGRKRHGWSVTVTQEGRVVDHHFVDTLVEAARFVREGKHLRQADGGLGPC